MALKKLKIFLAVSLLVFILVTGSIIAFGYASNNQSPTQQGSIISQVYIKRANGLASFSQPVQGVQGVSQTSAGSSAQPSSPSIRTRAS